MEEQRMVHDSSYEGPERRQTHSHCDKICSNHEYVQEEMKEMKGFKEETIGKVSKCMAITGILVSVFLIGITITWRGTSQIAQVASAHESLKENVGFHRAESEKEHEQFKKALTDLAVVANEVTHLQADVRQVQEDVKIIKKILLEER